MGAVGTGNLVKEAGSVIRCVECGAESEELAAGWRAYLAGDLNEDEDEVLLYARSARGREFGPFDEGLTAKCCSRKEEGWDSPRSTSSLVTRRARR